MLKFILSKVVFAKAVEVPEDDKCRVLALRGGGTLGAYEVGVLKAMSEMLDPIDIQYDVVEGVSVGALNAFVLATYPKGSEKDAIDRLILLWQTISAATLWSYWPLYIDGLLWKNSLFDT